MHFTARRAEDGIITIYIRDKDGLHPVAVMHPQRGDLEAARFLVRGANALLAIRELEKAIARAESFDETDDPQAGAAGD